MSRMFLSREFLAACCGVKHDPRSRSDTTSGTMSGDEALIHSMKCVENSGS